MPNVESHTRVILGLLSCELFQEALEFVENVHPTPSCYTAFGLEVSCGASQKRVGKQQASIETLHSGDCLHSRNVSRIAQNLLSLSWLNRN